MKKKNAKYGARIFLVGKRTLLVRQTIKKGRGFTDKYVSDGFCESHVSIENDAEIANAIRKAMAGGLRDRG